MTTKANIILKIAINLGTMSKPSDKINPSKLHRSLSIDLDSSSLFRTWHYLKLILEDI